MIIICMKINSARILNIGLYRSPSWKCGLNDQNSKGFRSIIFIRTVFGHTEIHSNIYIASSTAHLEERVRMWFASIWIFLMIVINKIQRSNKIRMTKMNYAVRQELRICVQNSDWFLYSMDKYMLICCYHLDHVQCLTTKERSHWNSNHPESTVEKMSFFVEIANTAYRIKM